MEISHRDIDLGFTQGAVLRYVRFFGISRDAVYDNEKLFFLREYQLVKKSRKYADRFQITEKGRMYLRFRFRSFYRFWIPTSISFLALLASYDVYVSPRIQRILESAMLLLKTILAG